jgi:hypothetical protein
MCGGVKERRDDGWNAAGYLTLADLLLVAFAGAFRLALLAPAAARHGVWESGAHRKQRGYDARVGKRRKKKRGEEEEGRRTF